MDKVPYSRQSINKNDIKSVSAVLKSDFLTTGPKVQEFEKKLTSIFSSKFSVAVNSATSALHIACMALNLKKNDYLWTTPISFVASSNCGLYCGAKIDFVDIDEDTFNISINKLENKLKETPKQKLPKILVLVHLSGHPVNLKEVKKLSLKYKFKIIEDASHAAGSFYNGSRVGNCKYSDICIFSFHPVKIITTAEGGAILTNSKKIFKKSCLLRSHGIDKNIKSKQNPWFYDQKFLGYNYRMNDIQAALGISQLSRLDFFVKKRNEIAKIYRHYLGNDKIKYQKLLLGSKSSMHLFIVRVNKMLRKKVYNNLASNGINTNLHYIPIYRHRYYKKFNFKKSNFQNSEKYYQEAITLPLYCDLKKITQMKIIKIINKTLNIKN
jgi:UDP-4-amino-4,6-dideoxy-N-acetyl-beta-L-altrosamine transaminase